MLANGAVFTLKGVPMSLLMKSYPGSVRTAAFSGQSWMLLLLLSLISLGSLEAQDSESFGKPTLKPWLATVDGSSVNLRTGPSTNHHAFTRLTKEVSVIAMGGSGDWVEIVIPSDIPIWIHPRPSCGSGSRISECRVLTQPICTAP